MAERIRGLTPPPLLLSLLRSGRWRHPGDDKMAQVMPWFRDPLHFPADVKELERENRPLDSLTADESTARVFRFTRGHAELPWLNVDQALLIATARQAGDDVAIALDFRTSATNPRVVASDIWTRPEACEWRTVTPTFADFVASLSL